MRTGINHLFIPGPTNVPESVRQAMNVPMQDQRAHDFGDLTLGLFADLKKIFKTESGHVLLLPGSGTGAWEAAMTNTLNPGDRVLMASHGQFSMLWVDMAQRLGLSVDLVDLPWGAGCPVTEFANRLAADTDGAIKGVFVTHNETATGVTSDVAAVRRAMDGCNHKALLFVDGVSSIGSLDFQMDGWGVDLAVTGSQKGLMLPAGLGILGISQKALAASKTSTMRRAYYDFADQLKHNAGGYFPYTPPTQLLHGLRKSLDRILAEGLDQVVERHSVSIRLGGSTYHVQSSASPQEVQQLADLVDDKMRELLPGDRPSSPQAFLLVALAFAHELGDERRRRQAAESRLNDLHQHPTATATPATATSATATPVVAAVGAVERTVHRSPRRGR